MADKSIHVKLVIVGLLEHD